MPLEEMIKTVKAAYPIITNRSYADSVSEKGDADFVTQVDIKVQEFIRTQLSRTFPDVQFMGEEGESDSIDFSKPVWILDPIDGTTNLIRDYRMSAVSLALAENGVPVAGVVYNPFNDELFTAQKGKGAKLNGVRIQASGISDMKDALISIGTMPYDKSDADKLFDLCKRLFLSCVDIRRSGSAALDLCYIACGRTDAYFERGLKPWDYAAGYVILNEAGGKATDFYGDALSFQKSSCLLAANADIHSQMLEYLKNL